MASAAKCIKFSTLLLVAYLAMLTDAGHHMALNALLATGLLTMLLRGKHGGHGHGGYNYLSGLSHGHSFGHHPSFSGYNFPHSFGIDHQNPSIGFNLKPLHHGLGNELHLGIIKPTHPLQNAGVLSHVPHLTGLKQDQKQEVHPSVPSAPLHGVQNNVPFSNPVHTHVPYLTGLKQGQKQEVHPSVPSASLHGVQNNEPFSNPVHKHVPHLTGLKQGHKQEVHPSVPSAPLHGVQNNLPFSNPVHKQISSQGHIPAAPAVTSGNPFEYKKPSRPIQNQHQPFVNQFFVMPRHATDELIEILENGDTYASFNENSESEIDNEDFKNSNYPPSPEQSYQYNPRSADTPYENPGHNLQ